MNINSIYNLKQIIGHKQANSPTQCPGDHLSDWIKGINLHPAPPPPEKKFVLSRYYTPVRHQEYYYRNYTGRELFEKALEYKVIRYEKGQYYHYDQGAIMLFVGVIGTTPEEVIKILEGDDVQRYLVKRETEYLADFEVNCHGDCLSTASTYKLTSRDAYRVVACPAKYPFRTKFVINGSTFTCWDRGGAITEDGNTIRLDIWAGIGVDGLKRIKRIGVPFEPKVDIILPQ